MLSRFSFRAYHTTKSKLVSLDGNSKKTITKEYVNADGHKITEFINISKHWNKIDPFWRKVILGYTGTATLSYCWFTYNDGKKSLINHRIRVKQDIISKSKEQKLNEEWFAIKDGCTYNSFNNFCKSFMFPFTIFNNIVPEFIFIMNKEDDTPILEKKEKKTNDEVKE